jgi:hypothetical protein
LEETGIKTQNLKKTAKKFLFILTTPPSPSPRSCIGFPLCYYASASHFEHTKRKKKIEDSKYSAFIYKFATVLKKHKYATDNTLTSLFKIGQNAKRPPGVLISHYHHLWFIDM